VVSTDANGRYLVTGIPTRSYRVTYQASGYGAKTVSVAIVSGSTTVVNVTLRKR
jgi:Carboxypeptidase regulatory-like domain